jgi:UDP-N-acetylmuramoyl-tripeptide--D-alanyl-D-alanine ligase
VDLTRDEIATITGGVLSGATSAGSAEPVARGMSFDSRTLVPGEGFVALHDVRDGHDYVADAFAAGASLALVERVPPGVDGPLVVVPDTAAALRALGVAARNRIEHATVIGITGSAGKTSTKDLTAAALAARSRVHASVASFNNEIGLPVTLLAAEDVEAVVLEMGARFAGNIRDLCSIARPSIGVITHIGLAHAEHLGGPAGIAAVKGELLDALPVDGLAVLNADDAATAELRARSAAPVLTAGSAAGADVRTSEVRLDHQLRVTFRLDSPWGSAPDVRLAVRGAYQVQNAALAAAVALAQGVSVEDVAGALATAGTAALRMEMHRSPAGVVVLNDSYNASPTSMRASLDSLAALPVRGRRIAVLGEMRELGPIAASEHAALGEHLADLGVTVLVVVGPNTEELATAAARRGVEVHPVVDHEAATSLVRAVAAPGDAVLVKASRAVGLERVAAALLTAEISGAAS